MSLPQIIVRVAFTTDPLDPAPSWETISTFTDGYSINVGKQAELDAYQPGTASLVLKNDDRRFDPTHTTGPYYPNVQPRKLLSIQAVWLGVTYDLYYGFVDGWSQKPNRLGAAVVPISCTDLFSILANLEEPSSVYAVEVKADSPKGWWRLNESAGPSLTDSSGNRHDGTYGVVGAMETADHPGPYEDTLAHVGTLDTPTPTVIDSTARITAAPFVVEGVFTIDEEAVDPPPADGYAMTFFRQGGADSDVWAYVGLWADGLGVNWQFIAGTNVTGSTVVRGVGSASTDRSSAAELAAAGPFHMAVMFLGGTTIIPIINGVVYGTYNPGGGNGEKDYDVFVGSNPRTPWQGVIADVAVYDYTVSSLRLVDHYDALFSPWNGDTVAERVEKLAELAGLDPAQYNIDPAATTVLGAATLGGIILDDLRLLEATEQGDLYVDHADGGKLRFDGRHHRLTDTRSTTVQFTFTDEDIPGAIHVERDSIEIVNDWQLIYNEVTVEFAGGGSVTVSDAASIAASVRRSHTVTTLLVSSVDARNLAEWVLSHYKDPITRIQSLTLNPAGDDTSAVAALDLRLGDLVEVKLKPQNVGTRETYRLLVEGKQHDIDKKSGTWATTLYLSPAETKVYGMWGSGEWGSSLWGY